MKVAAALLAAAVVLTPATLTGQATRGASHRHTRTSNGSIATRNNMGLSSTQISELQTALNRAGCDVGPVDGVMGPRTRRALACARHKNNVTGSNVNDVLRSLNVGFTVADSTGMGAIERSGRSTRAERAAARGVDTTSAEWKNQELHRDSVRARASANGRGRAHRDSAGSEHARGAERGDSTSAPHGHGRGRGKGRP